MPAFPEEDLASLYVTSASDNMSAADKAKEPMAGALFRLDVGVRGIARPYIVR
jgi:sugar lactone lactonase YvrE